MDRFLKKQFPGTVVFLMGTFPDGDHLILKRKLIEKGFSVRTKHLDRGVDIVLKGKCLKPVGSEQAENLKRKGSLEILQVYEENFEKNFQEFTNVRLNFKGNPTKRRLTFDKEKEEEEDEEDSHESIRERGQKILRKILESKEQCPLSGKKIMFGGNLKILKTPYRARQLVAELGGFAIDHNVTRSLDLFVVGDKPPEKRTELAQRYGVKIVSEFNFLKMTERRLKEAAPPKLWKRIKTKEGHSSDYKDDDDDNNYERATINESKEEKTRYDNLDTLDEASKTMYNLLIKEKLQNISDINIPKLYRTFMDLKHQEFVDMIVALKEAKDARKDDENSTLTEPSVEGDDAREAEDREEENEHRESNDDEDKTDGQPASQPAPGIILN